MKSQRGCVSLIHALFDFGTIVRLVKTQKNAFAILALSILIFSCYSNTFYASWQFDDAVIFKNSNFRLRDFSFSEIKKTFHCHPQKSSVIYRPISCLSLAINFYFGGKDVFGYHLVNISIHLAAAVFLYLLVRITLDNPQFPNSYRKEAYHIALLTGILWALSPIQTQAVTYIVQRMTSLAAMFCVMCLYFYVKGRISKHSKRYLFFAASLIAGLFSIGSKENTSILPIMIILYEFIFFQKADVKWLSKNIFFVISALIFPLIIFIFFWGENPVSAIQGYGSRDFSLIERLLTQSRVIVYYLSLLVYPSVNRLNFDHDFSISRFLVQPPTTIICIFFIFGLIALGVYLVRKKPLFSFSIFWFLGNLVIESSIIPLEIIFEHRLYLPSMFFYFVLAFVLNHHVIQKEWIKKPYAVVLVVLFIFLQGMGTYVRNFAWQNEITLWSDCVEKSPQKARTHHNLGHAFQKRGMLTEALNAYKKALVLDPHSIETHVNLGSIYEKKGMLEEAIIESRKALALNPEVVEAYNNLGQIYEKQGLIEEAIDAYRKAIDLHPKIENAYNNLAQLYQKSGQLDKALAVLSEAIRVQPDCASYYRGLGKVYDKKGMPNEAMAAYRKATELSTERGMPR